MQPSFIIALFFSLSVAVCGAELPLRFAQNYAEYFYECYFEPSSSLWHYFLYFLKSSKLFFRILIRIDLTVLGCVTLVRE